MPLSTICLQHLAPSYGHPLTWHLKVVASGFEDTLGSGTLLVTCFGPGAMLGSPLQRETPRQQLSPKFKSDVLEQVPTSTSWAHNKSKDVHKPCVDSQLDTWDERTEVRAKGPPVTRPYDTTLYRIAGGHERDVVGETCSELCGKDELEAAVAALSLLVQGSRVSTSLFYEVLRGCMEQKNLVLGRRVHALAVTGGYQANVFLANNILRMYASHGRLQEAMQVFEQVTEPSTYMWFSIISAHAELGEPAQALKLYRQMLLSTAKPNSYVFAAALKACARSADLRSGRNVHAELSKIGVVPDVFLGSSLVDMYAKCSSLEDALSVFNSLPSRNVVTWNSLINGFAEHGLGQDALALYARMEKEGLTVANRSTFSCLLKACASIGALQQGKQLHSRILERGLSTDMVIGTCLVDMYAKCGSLDDARCVFDNMPTRNVIIWTAMMAGYTEHGFGQEALALYSKMEQDGRILADTGTFACLLKACAMVGAIQQGKQLHLQILERGLDTDVVLGTCLLDMYAKCGRLEDACRVFDSLPAKNVITWTSMLHGFGQHEKGQEAIQCFQDMLRAGVQPNEATFTCLLVACSHAGLVKEGQQCFDAMVRDHKIAPTQKHYLCMVDLLGRSGHLDEAERMLLTMPYERDVVGWTTLLNACKSHGNIECGRRCFENLIRVDPQNSSPYVLMASMYAVTGRWTDAHRIERLRRSVGARKKAAEAGIEVNRQVHTFAVGQERDDISSKSRSMNVRLQEGGHVPHLELVLRPETEINKEDELCGHAEKLALAYGLLNTSEGTPLLVTKNLRMCGDCHSATQIMSRIEKREITVRDAHRVHRFVEGSCSCRGRP